MREGDKTEMREGDKTENMGSFRGRYFPIGSFGDQRGWLLRQLRRALNQITNSRGEPALLAGGVGGASLR